MGAVIYTVGATSDNAIVSAIGRAIGASMMGVGLKGLELSPFEAGAIRGFTSSVLSGGNLEQIFTNTLTGGLGSEIANKLPDILNGGDHGWSMSLALGHGITQGAMSVLRGQKFKTGFISGIAGKVTGAVINSSDLALADSFTKATIAALIGGIAAQASGGDFVEGAMTAMVVYLWNDWFDKLKKAYYSAKKFVVKNASNIVNVAAGSAQVVGGIALAIGSDFTIAGAPVGNAAGWAMVAHGINNIQEGIQGFKGEKSNGYLRQTYNYISDGHGNEIYTAIDLGLSGYGMIRQVGYKTTSYWIRGAGDIESTKPLYGYETMSKGALTAEFIYDANTIYSYTTTNSE